MAYPVNTGSLITATNYNEILSIVEQVAGTNIYGYGRQDLISISVSTGTRITRTQWINLINDINRIHYHQYGSDILFPTQFAGYPTTATWIMNVTTSVSTVSYTSLPGFIIESASTTYVNTTANVISTSTYTVHSSQLTPLITTGGTSVQTGTWTTYLGAPVDAIHHIVEAKWANTETAHYFFNLGGEIRFAATSTSVPVTWQDITVQRILAAISGTTATIFNRDNFISTITSTATVFAQTGTYSYVKVKLETLITTTYTASVFLCLSITDTSTTVYNLGTPWGSYWTTSTFV
ncbi:MAG: hypothetical protein EBU90_07135 [Proteobacteria bacterium]|nr:hypothetical protein [Pseudomonadota bacterium]